MKSSTEAMTALDRVIPTPALIEVDAIDLAIPPARAWEMLRHGDLGGSAVIRALFALRTLPEHLAHRSRGEPALRLDDLRSSPTHPGFQILADEPEHAMMASPITNNLKGASPRPAARQA